MLSALGTTSTNLCNFIALCKAAHTCMTQKVYQKISKDGRTCLKENYSSKSVLQLSFCAEKYLMKSTGLKLGLISQRCLEAEIPPSPWLLH